MAYADLIKYVPQQRYFEFDYLKAICRMLPLGSVWVTILQSIESIPAKSEERNTFVSILSSFAAELARLEIRVQALFRESVPGTSSEMLADWERVAGLPELGNELASTIAERQNLVHAKLMTNYNQGLSASFYKNYADTLGFAIRFYYGEYSKPFYVAPVGVDSFDIGSRMGDRLNDSGQIGTILVKVIGGLEGTEQMQKVFEIIKPAHCILVWEALIYNRLIIYDFSTYTFAEVGIGTLTNEEATDSATYAEDHANLLSQYGFKELVKIYDDDLETKRPTNCAYTKGPADLYASQGNFDFQWAIYSPMVGDSGVIAYNMTEEWAYWLKGVFPEYEDLFSGHYGIMSAAFDMSGSPVLAVEYAVDTIASWRAIEGIYYWTGYSPLVVCNQEYIAQGNPDNLLLDTIILYLEDLNGYYSEWNYTSVTSARDQIEFDTRISRTIKARFQRNNFGTAYTLITTDFDISYIENAWYQYDPDTYNPAEDWGKEYCLYISVRDTNKNRHTLKSANYFYDPYYPVEADPEEVAMTAEIESGELFETVAFAPEQVEQVAMTASLVSGELLNMEAKYDCTGSPEQVAMTASIVSGVLLTTTVLSDMQTDTASMTANIFSGACSEIVIDGGTTTESVSMTASIVSGTLETV